MIKLKNKLHEIIFGTETAAGRIFDLSLIWFIIISIISVMLESVEQINSQYSFILWPLEWFLTIFFTIEYLIRVFISPRPLKYIFSFFGLVDLFSVLPSYIAFFFPGFQSLRTIRALRLIRIFRILKLSRYSDAGKVILVSLQRSREKITVFLLTIITIAIVFGTIMYLLEGRDNGFTSIPRGIYWAIVTMTTVGFGDIVPKTNLGQFISAILMVLGYAVIAVPTGIVTIEMANQNINRTSQCPHCKKEIIKKD